MLLVMVALLFNACIAYRPVLEMVSDGGKSMYLPAEWGPRTRETTLLGDSATTTRRAELGCTRRGSPED